MSNDRNEIAVAAFKNCLINPTALELACKLYPSEDLKLMSPKFVVNAIVSKAIADALQIEPIKDNENEAEIKDAIEQKLIHLARYAIEKISLEQANQRKFDQDTAPAKKILDAEKQKIAKQFSRYSDKYHDNMSRAQAKFKNSIRANKQLYDSTKKLIEDIEKLHQDQSNPDESTEVSLTNTLKEARYFFTNPKKQSTLIELLKTAEAFNEQNYSAASSLAVSIVSFIGAAVLLPLNIIAVPSIGLPETESSSLLWSHNLAGYAIHRLRESILMTYEAIAPSTAYKSKYTLTREAYENKLKKTAASMNPAPNIQTTIGAASPSSVEEPANATSYVKSELKKVKKVSFNLEPPDSTPRTPGSDGSPGPHA